MSTKLEELKQKISSSKEKFKKASDKPEEKRALRKAFKRLQRKYRKQLPKTDQDRLNEANKLLTMVNVPLGELQKITKKQQGSPKMQSLKKKVKSLTKRVKILTAKLQPKEQPAAAQPAQTPPAAAQPAQAQPAQTPTADTKAGEQKT